MPLNFFFPSENNAGGGPADPKGILLDEENIQQAFKSLRGNNAVRNWVRQGFTPITNPSGLNISVPSGVAFVNGFYMERNSTDSFAFVPISAGTAERSVWGLDINRVSGKVDDYDWVRIGGALATNEHSWSVVGGLSDDALPVIEIDYDGSNITNLTEVFAGGIGPRVGTYAGNFTANHLIDIGFRPTFIIVSAYSQGLSTQEAVLGIDLAGMAGVGHYIILLHGANTTFGTDKAKFEIVDRGFEVGAGSGPGLNAIGSRYLYIAWP